MLTVLLDSWWATNDVPLTLLTGILALTTLVYAVTTGFMVHEMRLTRTDASEARIAAIAPRLMFTMEHPTQLDGRFVLVSCGAAAAFNVEVDIDYGPGVLSVHFSTPLMTAGSREVFMPEKDIHMKSLTAKYRRVRITGSIQDVERRVYEVYEMFELRHYWEQNSAAGWHHSTRRFTRLMRAVEKIAGVDSPVEP